MVDIPYISSIILKNFLSHKDTVLELTPGFNLLVGQNGTGKTAFIQAIDFLVSGKKNRYKKWEHYISEGENNASVILAVESKNGCHQFERRIGRKPSGVIKSNYYIDGKRKKLSQIRKKILSLGFNLLNPLVAVRQTNISRLMSELNPQTVLEAIEELSGVQEHRIRIEKVFEKITDSKEKIDELKYKEEQLKWKIEKLEDEKRLFERYEAIIIDIQNLSANESYYKIIELETDMDGKKELIKKSNKTISFLKAGLEKSIEKLELIEENIADLESLSTILQNDYQEIQGEIGKIGGKSSVLQEEIRRALINSKYDFALDNLQYLNDELSLKIGHLDKKMESLEEEKKDLSVSEDDIKKFEELVDHKKTIEEDLDQNTSNFLSEVRKFNQIKIDIDINTVLTNLESLDDASLFEWFKNAEETDFESMRDNISELSSKYQAQLFRINDYLKDKKSQLSELKQKVIRIKKEGKDASLPHDVARIKNHIRTENIDALGPICHYITFRRKEFETTARFMVSDQVWYSFIALSKSARQYIRELRGNSTKFRVVLHKSAHAIPQEIGVKSKFGRLIDGIKADPVIKGYLYEIVGDVQVGVSQEEADWLMRNKKSAITLAGVYCKPSLHYETDFRKFKAKVNLTSEDTRKLLQDLQNDIRVLQDEKTKELKDKRLFESTYKKLDNLRTILERIQPIGVKIIRDLAEDGRIQSEIDNFDSSIEKYFGIMAGLEDLSQKKQALLPKWREIGKIKNIQDQLELVKKKAEEFESSQAEGRENVKTINQQCREGQHKLQILESSNNRTNGRIEELLLLQAQNEDNILQIEKQIKELRGSASKTSPRLTKDEIRSSLDRLYRERAVLGTPDLKVLNKLRTEIHNLEKLQIRTRREENNVIKLKGKIEDTVEEWKTTIQVMVSHTEQGIQSILKNEEIDVKLSFQSKGKGIRAFRMSSVEILTTKKNSSTIGINGMSPGERSLIGMALLLGMQEALPRGGIRLLDEFDENLDRTNTIFVRDMIRDRTSQVQYLVLTPGKFPELGVGANIIRIQREHTDTKIWHGWPTNNKVKIEG